MLVEPAAANRNSLEDPMQTNLAVRVGSMELVVADGTRGIQPTMGSQVDPMHVLDVTESMQAITP